jgi:hypothetical protein
MINPKIIIIVLASITILISAFLVYEKASEFIQQQLSDTYQKGFDDGLTGAVNSLFQQTAECKSTTIFMVNYTRNLIDVSCLTNDKSKTSP